jgi:sec-independent protein translocase protein TatB
MFGIDFSEMLVILVVALVVVGPERLPKVARTLGHLWGRAQRYINSVKSDISRDMAIDEIHKLRERVQQEANGVEQAMSQATRSVDQQAQQLHESMVRPDQVVTPQIPRKSKPNAEQFPID